jgi:hypothetical protein
VFVAIEVERLQADLVIEAGQVAAISRDLRASVTSTPPTAPR